MDAVLNEIDEERVGDLGDVGAQVGRLTQLVLLAALQQFGAGHDQGADAETVNVRRRRQRLRLPVLRSHVVKIFLLGSDERNDKKRKIINIQSRIRITPY